LEDLSYYKGKLYLYFGITPAVILFWPFAALTGHHLFHGQAVPILCAIGFLASAGLLRAMWRRYFTEVSLGVVVACVVALGVATGVPVMLPRSEVYEVAVSCGYMLTMLSLGAIWCAVHEPERRCWWLAAASAACGLAVGARPTLAFGGIILLVPVIQAWRERRNILALLLAATGPILLIGLGLMIYNALRFGSPLEFGIRYQLAGERQVTRQFFNLRYLWFNFRVYFLEPVRWSNRFPFVGEIALPPVPVGHGGTEAPFGVLTNIPLVWLALAVPLAWRGRSQPTASVLRWFMMAVALLFGTCVLPVLFFISTTIRYEVEFLPALLLLAVVGILGLERTLADRRAWRRVARWGWGLLLSFSVAFNLLAGVGHYAEAYNNLGAALAQRGKIEEAIAHYRQALRIKPDFAEAHDNLGIALKRMGKVPEAAGHYEQALRIRPDFPGAQNHLAWLLATRLPAESGNAVRAVALAERACKLTDNRVATYLDTLAASYAAAGRFDDAVGTAQKAIQLADPTGQTQLVSNIEMRLELYRAGRAYYEPKNVEDLRTP
jgi:hypothetical protein